MSIMASVPILPKSTYIDFLNNPQDPFLEPFYFLSELHCCCFLFLVYVPDLESEYNLDSDDSRFNVTTSFSYQTFHNYLMKDFLSLILLITSFILLPVHIFGK